MKIGTINAIVMLNVADLTLPERNAKLHTGEQVEHIMNSITEFGMNDPIGVWGSKNIIVEGAGRWEACKRLAIESVPCIRLDHLTAEARRAYALAHNLTNQETGFDLGALNLEVSELDFNFAELGLDMDLDMDLLADLERNAFSDEINFRSDKFQITFSIDKQYQMEFKKYISKCGKDKLMELMLEEICRAVEAK